MTISPGGEADRILVAEQRAFDLFARRRRLHDHAWVVPARFLDRPVELLLAGGGRDPNARSEPRGLHPDRLAEAGGDLPPALLAGPAEVDLRHAMTREQILEDELVHADRGGLDVRARVGDVEHLEKPLDAAVLTAGAVQDRE